MKLINMAIGEDDADESNGTEGALISCESKYPYGLTITLCDESLIALGIKQLPAVGTKMMIEAMVEVCSASQHESKDEKEQSLTLQITDMCLDDSGDDESEKFYKKK